MGHWTNGWNFVTAGTGRDANSLEDIFIELNRVGFDGGTVEQPHPSTIARQPARGRPPITFVGFAPGS